jgi:glycerol-3-phosphate dehydrogenase
LYFDARGDDARIAMTIARTAADAFNAAVANYVRAVGFTYADNGEVNGVQVRDEITGESWTVATRSVVNATGVWVEEVTELGAHKSETVVTPAKGVHVSVPKHRLPADVAAVLAVVFCFSPASASASLRRATSAASALSFRSSML